ncbi:tyrosine-type recombinase/integrase [Jiangella rhizosphaerae]|uniref:Site-specific integrase n=1 Tax=Jiangella rhizosphaerae TaxID=2293569 RepID=A0A418KL57_9ACTN|nr:site-specific integrase [Jiangella rhizosphaerae]RIQ18262.1 site-specific integrase [Jiangella rhizosphaerae]
MTGRVRANGEGSIYPYRTGYAAYAWVTKPNGNRARKYVYGKTEDEVRDKIGNVREAAERGPVATSSMTVRAYALNWLEDLIRPNLAPATYAKYETFVRRYIIPGIGSKRVDRLTVRDVQTWLNKVRTTCQCCAQGKDAARGEAARCCAVKPRRCCKDLPAPSSVRAIRECVRSMLSAALTDELVTRNVAALVKLPHGRARQTQAWTSEQARLFLDSARRDHDPLLALYVLVLVLGLRKGEVLGLCWSDVNTDSGEVHLTRQLQRVGGELLHRDLKTDSSSARLPLPDIVVAALKQRRQDQSADQDTAGELWHTTDLVFTTRYGTPIEPRNVNRSFTRRCGLATVPTITVHDARRTCATLLVDLGVHPRVVMQILRHSKIAMTMEIYSKVTSDQTRDALRQLGDALGWADDDQGE